MRGNVHPVWVPQHFAIQSSLLGHLFKVHIPVCFVPGVFATLKPPVTELRRLQRLFYHPDGASKARESLCKSVKSV